MRFIELPSILLRRNGIVRIQKAVVDQMGRDPTVAMTFFGTNLALGSALELLLGLTAELVFGSYSIKSTFCTHCNMIEKWFTVVA